MALILLAPIVLIVALRSSCPSPGPVLYRQKRTGQYGVPFTCLKFRSMYTGNDPRILYQGTVVRSVTASGEVLGSAGHRDRGDEGGGGHGPHAGDGAQALDALIMGGDALDRLVGIRELAVEVAQDGEERSDQREQGAREGQAADPRGEGLGTAGGDAVPLLAEERPDERDVPGAGAHEGVADEQAAVHMTLNVGEAMRPAVGAEQTGVGQGARVSSVFTLRARVVIDCATLVTVPESQAA